jgi:hypothetical protein
MNTLLLPNTKEMSQSEAREALALALTQQWMPRYNPNSDEDYHTDYSIEDMRSMATEAIKLVQDVLGDAVDQLSGTLWSNENGGTDGRLPNLRRDAHKLIDQADKILGGER